MNRQNFHKQILPKLSQRKNKNLLFHLINRYNVGKQQQKDPQTLNKLRIAQSHHSIRKKQNKQKIKEQYQPYPQYRFKRSTSTYNTKIIKPEIESRIINHLKQQNTINNIVPVHHKEIKTDINQSITEVLVEHKQIQIENLKFQAKNKQRKSISYYKIVKQPQQKPFKKQKITGCRIALKKGVFPLSKAVYQKNKLNEHFLNQDALSTIKKSQNSTMEDVFISMNSFQNLVF